MAEPGRLLFPSKAGTHLDPKSFEIRLAAVSKRCEIRKVNPHALRHTLATRLVEDKVPLNIVGDSWDSSIETTRKYLHKNEDIEREAIGMMSNYLNMGQMDAAPRLNGAAPSRQVCRYCFADLSAAPKPHGIKRKNALLHTLLQIARKAVKRQHSNQNF